MTTGRTDNLDRLPLGKFLAFRMGFFSLAANMILMGFVMIYCSDYLGMPTQLAGGLILGSKILDAFAELYAGFLVDRTKTRFGKGRPWDLCLIGLWISTVLLFAVPVEASIVVKSVWVFVSYSLVQTVFQTMVQSGTTPYLMRAFRNMNVIVKVQSYGSVIGMALSIALSVAMPILIKTMATTAAGWTKVMIIISVPLLLLGLLRFIFVKEEYNNDQTDEENIGIKDVWRAVISNKYIWCVCGINFVINIISGINAGTYYFTYIVGDLALMSTLAPISIALLPVMFFMPKLIKKFSVSAVIAAGCVASVLGGILLFFAKADMTLLLVGYVLNSVGLVAPPYMTAIMVIDCARYNTLRGKPSMEASLAAVNQFGGNIGQGMGGAVLGFLLAIGGYVGTASEQTPGALLMIRLLMSLIPAAFFILMFVCARLFKVEKENAALEQKALEVENNG